MEPASNVEKKATVDAVAWMFKAIISVGIIIVNKALMASYGFTLAMFLLTLHLHKFTSLFASIGHNFHYD